jgi:RNA polymerase sigma-70 factor, ECF subfamily
VQLGFDERMTVFADPETYAQAPPEQSLLEQCISGDQEAWGALHRQYFPIATSFLRRLGVRESDLEDAAQEVFVQVFRYLPRFRGQAEFRTWLYQLCITQRRRMRRSYFVRDTIQRVFLQKHPDAQLTGPGFSEEIAQRRLDAALAKLPEAERVVFVLYEMQNLSGKEIGTIVGANAATVWRRLHYARRSLQVALGLRVEDAS